MPQAPECRMCGEFMELRIIRTPHPASDLRVPPKPSRMYRGPALRNRTAILLLSRE
jgi:hypothetical protein